jgi:hypothetical protein
MFLPCQSLLSKRVVMSLEGNQGVDSSRFQRHLQTAARDGVIGFCHAIPK